MRARPSPRCTITKPIQPAAKLAAGFTLEGSDGSVSVRAVQVSASYFETLGIPLLGLARRLFGQATTMMLPRSLSHPVEETKKSWRKKRRKAKGTGQYVAMHGRRVLMADPEEIGNVVCFLASDLASYVSGATVECHGGGEPPVFLHVVHKESP